MGRSLHVQAPLEVGRTLQRHHTGHHRHGRAERRGQRYEMSWSGSISPGHGGPSPRCCGSFTGWKISSRHWTHPCSTPTRPRVPSTRERPSPATWPWNRGGRDHPGTTCRRGLPWFPGVCSRTLSHRPVHVGQDSCQILWSLLIQNLWGKATGEYPNVAPLRTPYHPIQGSLLFPPPSVASLFPSSLPQACPPLLAGSVGQGEGVGRGIFAPRPTLVPSCPPDERLSSTDVFEEHWARRGATRQFIALSIVHKEISRKEICG